MRILGCALASPGFLYPILGLLRYTKEIYQAECAYVSGLDMQQHARAAEIMRIPKGLGDGESFSARTWADPMSIATQTRHVEYALDVYGADIIVTNHLAIGPMLAAERRGIPVCVVGGPSYLYPTSGRDDDERRIWCFTELTRVYNDARRILAMPIADSDPEASPLLGDAFLLQLPPSLAERYGSLPSRVRCVGSLLWEPSDARCSWHTHLSNALLARRSVNYVQLGRPFKSADPWTQILEAIGASDNVSFVAVGRREDLVDPSAHENVYIGDISTQAQILRNASAVITSGHPTSVIGALTQGVPLLMFPNGSGTYDTADLCLSLGVCKVMNNATVTVSEIATQLEVIRRDDVVKSALHTVSEAYRCIDGAYEAATTLRALLKLPTKQLSATG